MNRRAVSMLECLIGMIIFLMAILPIWQLMNNTYGNIQVSNDDLVANIVSTCLINEYGSKCYDELKSLIPLSPRSENNIYETNIDAEVILTEKTSDLNYYDYIEVTINLTQKIVKPKSKIKNYSYTVSVPKLY